MRIRNYELRVAVGGEVRACGGRTGLGGEVGALAGKTGLENASPREILTLTITFHHHGGGNNRKDLR